MIFGDAKKEGRLDSKKRIILIVSAIVLAVAIGIAYILWMDRGKAEDTIESTEMPVEVAVNGVDISGMTKEQLTSAIKKIQDKMLDNYLCTLECNGEIFEYTADDFNVSTNYEEVVAQALAAKSAEEFIISMTADTAVVNKALAALKQEFDKAPKNASVMFAPCGFTQDGMLYEPDPKEMADAHADGDELDRPNLVRRDATDIPNRLRYQFWNEDRYEEDYIPVDADIMRFQYTEDEDGLAIDVEAAAVQILNALESADSSTIVVTAEAVEADVTVEELKKDTQLITSWTSSYREHSSFKRNWNVSRMSSFINNTVIEPGEEWSVNETAGARNATTARKIGWKKAAGLYQGATTQQYGGGVCQLGSTTYNAALRADLTIVEFHHHSDPSGYIPKGLDATLDYVSTNSNGKDLVLRNDSETPVYMVSYIDPEKETVTVEVYGRLPYNDAYGQQVIYDYTSDNKGTRYGSGRVITIEATQTPKGDVLSPENPTIVFSSPRRGYKVEVYKHIYTLDGTELNNTLFRVSKYKPINGYTYVYPADLMPSPTPTIDPTTPTVDPTPTPGDPTPTPGAPTPTPGAPTPTPGDPTPTPGNSDPQP